MATVKTIIITAGTSVTLPSDWNPTSNTIEVIGGGYSGSYGGGGGGPGGSYAIVNNFGNPSTSYTISIGPGGSAATSLQSGSSTWLSNTGSAPTSTSQGVLATSGAGSSIGDTTYAGGSGGAGTGTTNKNGGGGGGAAGPTGAGNTGSAGGGAGGSGSAGSGGATT